MILYREADHRVPSAAEMFKGWYREKKYILTLSWWFVRKDHVGVLVPQLFSRLEREGGQWFESSIIRVLFVFFIRQIACNKKMIERLTFGTHQPAAMFNRRYRKESQVAAISRVKNNPRNHTILLLWGWHLGPIRQHRISTLIKGKCSKVKSQVDRNHGSKTIEEIKRFWCWEADIWDPFASSVSQR